MELDKAIQSRRSVRKFNSKKPDWRKIIECVESMRYAPMAGNSFTLKVIIVSDEQKIRKLAEASQQQFVSNAKYVVVVCSNPSRTANEFGKENAQIWTRQQAGAAIENFLLKIVENGLSTCWVGYFVEEQIKKELKIPNEVNVEAIFPVGYEIEKPRTKRLKIDLDRVLYFEEYDNKHMKKQKQAY